MMMECFAVCQSWSRVLSRWSEADRLNSKFANKTELCCGVTNDRHMKHGLGSRRGYAESVSNLSSDQI